MKATLDIPEWLRTEVERRALAIAVAHEIPLEHLRSTSHKTMLVAEARSELVGWIREHLVCLCDRHGATIDFALRANVARGGTTRWSEPSYPVIGQILDIDHSSAFCLHRKWMSRTRRNAADQTNGVAAPAA